MENELQILNNIEKNKNTTQRDLAKNTGMSLGNVNILIKRLVRKGLLKIEKLNPRTIRYILTPEGLREKAELTYRYVVASYKFINEINSRIDAVLGLYMHEGIRETILFGGHDEVCEILRNKFNQVGRRYTYAATVVELAKYVDAGAKTDNGLLILVWQHNYVEILSSKGINFINLLDNI